MSRTKAPAGQHDLPDPAGGRHPSGGAPAAIPDRPGSASFLAWTVVAVWAVVAMLASLSPITDGDLGFHISWGRILLHDFSGAGTLLLGQDPSVTVYAYAYWGYEVLAATLYDRFGPWGLVLFRIAQVAGMFTLAFLVAGRLGASARSRALLFALGIAIAYERFVDRPDVLSHLLWMVGLWIVVVHRRDRGVWALVPLMILWVNLHHHFTLLLALYGAFVVGDALEGYRPWRRSVLVFGTLLLATLINPVGPGSWVVQVKLLGVFTRHMSPVPVSEVLGSYARYKPFLALWIFRIAMPLLVAAAVVGRKRIGLGAVLALLIPTLLAILARRAISWFGLTAVALVPPALDEVAARLAGASAGPLRGRARPAAGAAWIGACTLALAAGIAAAGGMATGRLFLRQDREYRVGEIRPIRFACTGAARFLRREGIQGPIYNTPTTASAILLENGTRLTPFSDTRWCGTRDEDETFVALLHAEDRTVRGIWDSVQRSHGFETVMLDAYDLPALLRCLVADPGWALVYRDDRAVVFCRRGGRNSEAIRRFEPQVAAACAAPDTDREAELARAVVGFLRSPTPSWFVPMRFPWDAFQRANLALQMRDRPDAEVAYLDLFRREGGSLHVSTHQTDILGNLLWCLAESKEWEARAALCAALAREEADPARRRLMRLGQAQALLQVGKGTEAEPIAVRVAEDPASGSEELWWAWSCAAGAREARGDHGGAVQALRAAAQARPAPETYRVLGSILDSGLQRYPEALQAYEKFLSLGGRDSTVERRVRQLRR